MDNVRVVVRAAGPDAGNCENRVYDSICQKIDDWWIHFFTSSVQSLCEKVREFLSKHVGSPFPVIVHVMPPQDDADATRFVSALKGLGVPFVDRKVHHIQQDVMILFNSCPPPADIPRVLAFLYCYDDVELFHQFLEGILRILFGFGLTPESSFIFDMKTLYFCKYRSFTYLLTLVKQSIFLHLQKHESEDFEELFERDPSVGIEHFLLKASHSRDLPTASIVKIRATIMDLYKVLAERFQTNPSFFENVEALDQVWNSPNMRQLYERLGGLSVEELKVCLMESSGILRPLFEEQRPPSPVIPKSRRSRMMAMANQADQFSTVDVLTKVICKAFDTVPDDSSCLIHLTDTARFDPRAVLKEMMSNEDNTTDTAVAYQLLQEHSKTVSSSEWMAAFSAKLGIENKALALSRFQVAVSELEYLGCIDKNTRKSGTFRKILRV